MILIGPAGTSGLGIIKGLEEVKKLGLSCMEVEFTYGVNMSNQTAKQAGELAKKLNISLSVHCPYYINLASMEKIKIKASMKRILESCERGFYLNAKYIVFHPGFYGKYAKEECYEIIKESILEMQKIIKEKKFNAVLCPVTAGKKSQFGSLDELTKLHKETGCGICIDFAHLLAREGKVDYDDVMKKIKSIKEKTAHFSGIEYTEKGERRHIMTEERDIEKLLKALKKYNISIRIINESPNPILDSLKTKKILGKI